MGAPVLPSQHEGATQMYINFGSINSRQAADGSCTAYSGFLRNMPIEKARQPANYYAV